MLTDRPPFEYHTDCFPYDAASFESDAGLLKSLVLGLALIGTVLLVAACFGPDPAPVAAPVTSNS